MVKQKWMSFTVAVSMVLLAGCGDRRYESAGSKVQAVIGKSQLKSVHDSGLTQVVGRLSFPQGDCTAFVTGAHEITTAGHCLEGEVKADLGAMTFKTAAGTESGVKDTISLDTAHDVAVLRVEAKFSQWMSWADTLTRKAKVVGFNPEAGELQESAKCRVEESKLATSMLTYSCDTVPGMSGAPLIGEDGRVIGVHVGHLTAVRKNMAADATKFAVKPDAASLTDTVNREWGPKIKVPEIKVEWPKEMQPTKVEPRHLACIYSLQAGYADSTICGGCLTAAGTTTAGVAAAACSLPCGMAVADLTAVIISCR